MSCEIQFTANNLNIAPSISVIMSIYNEAHYIESCLKSVLTQDYKGIIEVLCIDGMSKDGTSEIIRNMALHDNRIRIINNLKGTTSVGLNIGIKAARYEYIARVDGHSILPPDYLYQCVSVMERTKADNVGGHWICSGDSFVSRAIIVAMHSAFSCGTAHWRISKLSCDTDSVPFGFWKRELLLKLGGFNETLLRNQDYELNYRIRMTGGRIFFARDIVSTYFPRSDLKSLWIQYYQYGLWKAYVILMHPKSCKLRHMIAPLFILGLAIGLVCALLFPFVRIYYSALLIFYILLSLLFNLKQGWKYLFVIPVICLVLHLSWGIGFWIGLIQWIFKRVTGKKIRK